MSLEEKRNLNGNIPLEDHIHIIMETVRKIKQSNSNKMAKIETCLEMMVDLAIATLDYRGYLFLQKEKDNCKRIAVLSILELWLYKDKSIAKTIYKSAKDNGDVDKVLEEEFRRAGAILRDNITLQNEQAKMEGTSYKRMQHKKGSKVLYDPMHLAFIERYNNMFRGVYKQLFYIEDSLNKANKRDLQKWQNAYDDLNRGNKDLLDRKDKYKGLVDDRTIPIISPKEGLNYISYFLHTIKLERTYRPAYVARLAKYIQKNGYSVDDINKDVVQISLNRYKNDQMILTNASSIFFAYDENFDILFEKNAEVVNCYIKSVLMMRKLIDDALLLFNKHIGLSFLGKFKEEDIKYVVKYITCLHSVDELFQTIEVKTTDSQHIKNIQKIYKSDIFHQEYIKQARKGLRKIRELGQKQKARNMESN